MAHVFRFPPPRPAPKNIHRATLFQMKGPSGRLVTCAAFDTQSGLELRLWFGDALTRSESFRGIDHQERLAARADSWRIALLKSGFTEVHPED